MGPTNYIVENVTPHRVPMRQYRVKQVDVFTDNPLAGNPLAVILDAESLARQEMQMIAKEMNLSETTFVLSPSKPNADYRVRIFTPSMEIPFAGHPCIGTAYVLAKEGVLPLKGPLTTVHQQLEIGVLPLEIHQRRGRIEKIVMEQSKPRFGRLFKDVRRISVAAGVKVRDIEETGLPPQIVSTGINQLMVPVGTLKAVQQSRPDLGELNALEREFGFYGCSLFTQETLTAEASVHVRYYSPEVGVPEDPATGSAAGGLGAYLVKWNVLSREREATFVIEQGYEIGRPSKIHVEVEVTRGAPTRVRVGGEVVPVIEGVIALPK